ncbi:RES domain-containing protein [Rhodovibrio salinarum]|uniref:RES domain-containing protein n=1 Tax=Rhodovibrio salinarum TaxID=1087 RepID=A0A934QM28_9PROT|nr:RES domain-containing protein [Rhodovibrio salinarum]
MPDSTPATAWRLTRAPYADLSGRGGQLKSGRWNTQGRPVVYLSLEASLPVLEVLMNLDLALEDLPPDYVLMRVDLSPLLARYGDAGVEDATDVETLSQTARSFGDTWLAEGRTPCLRVASHLIPEASNLLLNPLHPGASLLEAPSHRPFRFDPRLFAHR